MAYQTSSRNRSSGRGTTPSWTMPMPATMAVMAARMRAMVARAPANLPLMTSSRQIGCERGGVAGADREQLQEGGRRAAGGRGDVADAARGGVDGAHRGQAEAEREQEEAHAVEVVGELLGGGEGRGPARGRAEAGGEQEEGPAVGVVGELFGGDDAPAASLGIGVVRRGRGRHE